MGLQEFPELLFKGGRLGGGDEPAARAVEHPQLAGLQEFPEALFKGGRRAGGLVSPGVGVPGRKRTPNWWRSRNFRNCSLRGEGLLGTSPAHGGLAPGRGGL